MLLHTYTVGCCQFHHYRRCWYDGLSISSRRFSVIFCCCCCFICFILFGMILSLHSSTVAMHHVLFCIHLLATTFCSTCSELLFFSFPLSSFFSLVSLFLVLSLSQHFVVILSNQSCIFFSGIPLFIQALLRLRIVFIKVIYLDEILMGKCRKFYHFCHLFLFTLHSCIHFSMYKHIRSMGFFWVQWVFRYQWRLDDFIPKYVELFSSSQIDSNGRAFA